MVAHGNWLWNTTINMAPAVACGRGESCVWVTVTWWAERSLSWNGRYQQVWMGVAHLSMNALLVGFSNPGWLPSSECSFVCEPRVPADEKHLSKCKICVLLTLVLTSQSHWNKFTLSKQELTTPMYKPGAARLACLDTGWRMGMWSLKCNGYNLGFRPRVLAQRHI